jgi:hypothetical protein
LPFGEQSLALNLPIALIGRRLVVRIARRPIDRAFEPRRPSITE